MNFSFLSPFSAFIKPNNIQQQAKIDSDDEINPKPNQQSTSIETDVLSLGIASDDSDNEDPSFPAQNGPQRVSTALQTRKKVMLQPGHSQLDWARLKKTFPAVKLQRYTIDEVKVHNKKGDCWLAVSGKVYDVTEYMKFHPGGDSQLMKGVGKDATEMYFKVHAWVNIDHLLDGCHIGYLIK